MTTNNIKQNINQEPTKPQQPRGTVPVIFAILACALSIWSGMAAYDAKQEGTELPSNGFNYKIGFLGAFAAAGVAYGKNAKDEKKYKQAMKKYEDALR